jgi:hypothetical protein
VQPPYFLVLEDAAGSQRARLLTAEYGLVVGLVLSPEFVSAIRLPNNPDCGPVPDSTATVRANFTTVGMQSVIPGTCFFPDASNHIYARLGVVMNALLNKYVVCPDADADAAPAESRALCRYTRR